MFLLPSSLLCMQVEKTCVFICRGGILLAYIDSNPLLWLLDITIDGCVRALCVIVA